MDTFIYENVVIFNRNNPNFEIKDTNEEISKLFEGKLIPVLLESIPERVAGYVDCVGEWVENKLFGNIRFWKIEQTNYYELKNYEICIDMETNKIRTVNCITLG